MCVCVCFFPTVVKLRHLAIWLSENAFQTRRVEVLVKIYMYTYTYIVLVLNHSYSPRRRVEKE